MALAADLRSGVAQIKATLNTGGLLQSVGVTPPNGVSATTYQAYVSHGRASNREEWEPTYGPETRTVEDLITVTFFEDVPMAVGTRITVDGVQYSLMAFRGPTESDGRRFVTSVLAGR